STKAARSALMQLVSRGAGAAELYGGAVQERLNPLQRGAAPAFLVHHVGEELPHHLVDRGPAPCRHGPGFAQEILLDHQGHVQSLHDRSSRQQHSTDSVQKGATLRGSSRMTKLLSVAFQRGRAISLYSGDSDQRRASSRLGKRS